MLAESDSCKKCIVYAIKLCMMGCKIDCASGLVVKSNVAIVGPRVRFTAGAKDRPLHFFEMKMSLQAVNLGNGTAFLMGADGVVVT